MKKCALMLAVLVGVGLSAYIAARSLACADEKKAPKPFLPEGMKGFSGMLTGKVVEKGKNGFVLEVQAVLKVWKGNRAKNPKSAIGKKLLINVQWRKGKNGTWHPDESHLRFVRTLRIGEAIEIEVINDEGARLHILELSEAQRNRK
jgi:hypothetical protein